MTASKELETLFMDARQQVGSWPTWQRSIDPQGAESEFSCSAQEKKTAQTAPADEADANAK
jgi:hypothetical protein